MTAILILVKASLVMSATALALGLAGRRASAASRHVICTLGLAGLLMLPVFWWVLPGWTALELTAAAAAPSAAPAPADSTAGRVTEAAGAPTGARPAGSWPAPGLPMILLTLYGTGVVALLVRLIAHRLSIHRIAVRATGVDDPDWLRWLGDCAARMDVRRPVRLLRSREHTMPMTIGIRSAAIIIPAEADLWSEDRRRAVLLHELAHVVRHDCLTQAVAAVAGAFYWMHPGAWWMTRRLQAERELACDDLVLSAGTDAREYAGHLLELAYALRGDAAPALAVSMASPRQLEGRMLAALDAARNRSVPPRGVRLAGLALLTAAVVPMAAATATSAPAAYAESEGAVVAIQPAPAAAPARTVTPQPGTWDLRRADATAVQLRLREGNGTHGFPIGIEALHGLSPAQLADGGPVQFQLVRDAGTFTFDGVVRNGVGGGTFEFTPNDAFAAGLVNRGFERPTHLHLRRFAYANIGYAFLDELNAQGYARPTLDVLARAADHGAGAEYLRQMGELGYRLGRLEALIELRNVGVTPQYISALTAEGLPRLSVQDLLRARNHGVSPEYISQMREAGHGSLDLDQLIVFRNHGVDAEYIRALGELGFKKLSRDALIDARNRGFSPEYIRQMREAGYTLNLADLATARNHGIEASYINELSALGYQRLTLDALVRLRSHGVEPTYVRQFRELGYASLTLEDLVGLRASGVTADQARRANERAGSRLPVDRLRALAATGWR